MLGLKFGLGLILELRLRLGLKLILRLKTRAGLKHRAVVIDSKLIDFHCNIILTSSYKIGHRANAMERK